MGTDKATVWWNGKPMVHYTIELIQSMSLEIILSVNPTQYPQYRALFQSYELIADDNRILYQGPMKGILSVHQRFPTEDLLVMACDTPLVSRELIQRLLQSFHLNKGYEVYLFSINGQYEPLLGIYTASGLNRHFHSNQPIQPVKSGMRYLLDKLNVKNISSSEQERMQFKNFNSPLDLESNQP